jgi:hypothetical protein
VEMAVTVRSARTPSTPETSNPHRDHHLHSRWIQVRDLEADSGDIAEANVKQ